MNASTNQNITVDEFGRDDSLRYNKKISDYIDMIIYKFKTMSWVDVCDELDEEEERERENELKKLNDKRKALLAAGQYELEEGEIIE